MATVIELAEYEPRVMVGIQETWWAWRVVN